MIKIFFIENDEGKISFTKDEIQKLLNEAEEEGRKAGYSEGYAAGRTSITDYNKIWKYEPYSPYYSTTTNDTTGTSNKILG